VAFGFRALIFWRCLLPAYRGFERNITGGTVLAHVRPAFSLIDAMLNGLHRGTAPKQRHMTNPLEFLQEVRAEGAKVTWPTRRETLVTTGLVIFMVLLASLFFVAVDQTLRLIVTGILSLGH
jgi:preprotein translocase subunit SecE